MKNFFGHILKLEVVIMSFVKIPNKLISQKRRLTDIALYATLAKHADFKTFETYISRDLLSEKYKLDLSTITRTFKALESSGLIRRERRHNQSSIITIKPPKEDYTQLPVEYLDLGLTAHEIGFLAKLLMIARDNIITGLSKNTISQKINVDIKTLNQYLQQLMNKGVLSIYNNYIVINSVHELPADMTKPVEKWGIRELIAYFNQGYEKIYGSKLLFDKSTADYFKQLLEHNPAMIRDMLKAYFEAFNDTNCKVFKGNVPNIWHFCHARNQELLQYAVKYGCFPSKCYKKEASSKLSNEDKEDDQYNLKHHNWEQSNK